jgi:hypothetical protein
MVLPFRYPARTAREINKPYGTQGGYLIGVWTCMLAHDFPWGKIDAGSDRNECGFVFE